MLSCEEGPALLPQLQPISLGVPTLLCLRPLWGAHPALSQISLPGTFLTLISFVSVGPLPTLQASWERVWLLFSLLSTTFR